LWTNISNRTVARIIPQKITRFAKSRDKEASPIGTFFIVIGG
jgi:hypothetical protein